MRLDGFERQSAGTGILHGLDARQKLVSSLAFVLCVIATPIGWWTALASEGLVLAFVIGLAGIPPRELGRRWLAFFVFFGFLAFMVAPAHPARARYGLWVVAASILIKNSLALLIMLVLAATPPVHKLLAALRKLGVPPVLVASLPFMVG
jgi:cobalt/nickel transport system permease protein